MHTVALRPRARRHRAVLPLLLLLLLALSAGPGAAPASAHTKLESSTPADGASVDDPLDTVTLEFSRPVELLGDTLTVRGAPDRAVDVTRSDNGTVVAATVSPALPGGQWALDWRILASDGHPREGTLTVDVEAPASAPTTGESTSPSPRPPEAETAAPAPTATTPPAAPSDTAGTVMEAVATTARIVLYLGLLVAVGLVLFKAGPHRGEPERARVLARVAATVATVAAIAGVVESLLHVGAVSGRGLAGAVDPTTLRAVGRTGIGTATVLRTVGLGLVALGAWRRARTRLPSGPDAVALVGALLAIGSFQFVGHTTSAAPEAVVRVADAVHAVAAAVWVGGIAGLALLARSRDRRGRMRTAMRFSDAATWAVVAVGIGGIALAWTTMPTLSALWTTTWGGVLVAKLALVAVLGAIGAHNHVRLVPRLGGGAPDAEVALHQLRRTVAVEAVLMLLILSLTAVLVSLSPV